MPTSPHAAAITSSAVFFPPEVRDNAYFYNDLGLETSEEWILSRTGVRERRVARLDRGESCGTLATAAAQHCLRKRGIEPTEIDGILLGTISGDLGFPATACLVQDRIGAANAFAFDISGACTGYLHALATATAMVESGRCRRVMAIGAEAMSAILDYEDRTTCLLFGDGAGATLVEKVPGDHPGRILDITLGSDGSGAKFLYRTGGGALHLPDAGHPDYPKVAKVWQDGRAVFRFAVQRMVNVIRNILAQNRLTLDDIALVVPHQANIRIIEAACTRLKLPLDKVAIYVDRYANTVAATLPTALDLSATDNRIAPGDLVLLATFGAGLSWGAALLRWGEAPSESR